MTVQKKSMGLTQWFSGDNGVWTNSRVEAGGLNYWRVGRPDDIQALAGLVLRGWTIKGRIMDRAGLREPLRLRAFYGVAGEPPEFPVTMGLYKIDVVQADTTRPLGVFPPPNFDFSEVNSPAWAGLQSLSWAMRRESDPIPYPSLSEFFVLVSPRPSITVDAPSGLDVDGEATIRVTLQYPDGEKVRGFRLRLGVGNHTVVRAGGGSFGLFAVATTDNDGVATFTVRGTSGGEETVWVGLPNNSPLARVGQLFSQPMPLPVPLTVRQVNVELPPEDCTIIPGRPGVPPTPSRYEPIKYREWNAGANSVDELDGDVSLRFDTPRAEGTVIGFTQNRDIEAVGSIERITHGFYFHYAASGASVYRVIESGKAVTPQAPHDPTQEFEVRRVGSTVFYFVDGVQVHRSRVPSSGTLSVGSALYASGDTAP